MQLAGVLIFLGLASTALKSSVLHNVTFCMVS